METNADTQIIMEFELKFVIDLVSDPDDTPEYRCSVYDEDSDLMADGWGSTPNMAIRQAMKEY